MFEFTESIVTIQVSGICAKKVLVYNTFQVSAEKVFGL